MEPHPSPDPQPALGGAVAVPIGGDGALGEAAEPVPPDAAAVVARVVRLAAGVLGAPFAQLVRFEPGPPVSYGALAGEAPDLRPLGGRLPPGAALVVVEDAARDVRFEGALPPETRFFAWAAVEAEGAALGALAVLDTRPHPAAPAERLLDLAALAADVLRMGDAEARWAEAEARFQALGELVSDAVVIADPEGCVLDANDRAVALLGCDGPDALIGRPLDDLAPGGDDTAGIRAEERSFPFEGRPLRLAVLRPGPDA